jgi:hypothetical protein
MPNDSSLIIVALIAIIALLLAILVRLWVSSGPRRDEAAVAVLNEATERFAAAATHHAEVNAVLALTQTLEDRPDLLRRLPEYSREAWGAALLHHVNTLGNDLKMVRTELSRARSYAAHNASNPMLNYQADVDRLEGIEFHLMEQMGLANGAVQTFNAPRAV